MAELIFWTGTMNAGKSTLALQTHHNHTVRGLRGLVFVCLDRSGDAKLTSRLGLEHPAIEVTQEFDFWSYLVDLLTRGERVDYLICDEAHFYEPAHIEQLANVVDELEINVFCFAIQTDFRTRLFPATARLVELADRTEVLQVEALCWCGRRATHNARTENGEMVTDGDVIVVGDVDDEAATEPAEVAYEVLCRRHHRRGVTIARARAAGRLGYTETLPFT